jgi:hypothetical protein
MPDSRMDLTTLRRTAPTKKATAGKMTKASWDPQVPMQGTGVLAPM